jgi:hypothetical protein
LDDIAVNHPPFFLIDRLNEVPGQQIAYNILQSVSEYARRRAPKATYVLAATRNTPVDLDPSWTVLLVEGLSEQVAKDRFGEKVYEQLPSGTKERLKGPYYLRLAIRAGHPRAATAAAAISDFLRVHGKLDDDALDKAAEAAYDAYMKSGSTAFPMKDFVKLSGDAVLKALVDARVIIPSSGHAKFAHQLYHDYLAARHCAANNLWRLVDLDGISLLANSFSALNMVLEQLGDPGLGDRFLHAVYDWNFYAAIEGLSVVEGASPERYTWELEAALLALVSEKLFDDVLSTQERVRKQFEKLSSPIAKQISSCRTRAEVARVVTQLKAGEEWFQGWKALFLLWDGITEEDVSKINSADSIVGWTAANVVKRFREDDVSGVQLREMYRSHRIASGATAQPSLGDTIRWRVVNSLGGFSTETNANLLLNALDDDPYHWTRYGAARSLVESAAKAENTGLRDYIVAELGKRIQKLSTGDFNSLRALEAIGRAVFFRTANEGWHAVGQRLLQGIVDAQRNEGSSQLWSQRLDRFKEWRPEGKE